MAYQNWRRSRGGVLPGFILGMAVLVLPTVVSASVEITGFGDLFYAMREDAEDGFEIGQVEIDLEAPIDEKIVVGTAVAYDSGQEIFGLGAFTMDLHLLCSEGSHFRPSAAVRHSGIIVGQFDVPFGIDWNVYPSIDRKLVSTPLAVENTHDSWNDYGIQAYAEMNHINAVLYGTNGWGWDGLDTKMAIGGRLGVGVHEGLEIGGSCALFLSEDNTFDMILTGVDLQWEIAPICLKGEYLFHRITAPGGNSDTNVGYYLQGCYEYEPYFLVARYGHFAPGQNPPDDESRISVGLGWVPVENWELRAEYQANLETEDALFLQTVVAF